MTGSSDHPGMKRRMSEREMDALLRGPLADVVAEITALGAEVPPPSPALYALLQEGVEPDPAMVPTLPRVPRSRARLVPVPLAALVIAGTVGAASANALPAPAQRVVSDTVATLTPIHLPRPAAKPRPTPVVTPTEQPERAVPTETGRPTSLPQPALSHRAPEATDHPEPHATGSHRGRGGDHHEDGATTRPTAAHEATTSQDGSGDSGRDGQRSEPTPSPAPAPTSGDHQHDDRSSGHDSNS